MSSCPDLLENRINYLPPRKRRQLAHVAKVLFEAFQQAQSSGNRKILRNGCILKPVLFGAMEKITENTSNQAGYDAEIAN